MKIKYYLVVGVGVAFLILPLFSKNAFSELPTQSRELQFVWVKDGYQVAIDNDPAWTWRYLDNINGGEFVAISPDLYYPPSAVSVKIHSNVEVSRGEHFFKRVALTAINTIAKKYDVDRVFQMEELNKKEYGGLSGFSVDFVFEKEKRKSDIKIFIARNNTNQVLSLTASTLEGKLPHLSPVLDRMWSNISFADGNKYKEN